MDSKLLKSTESQNCSKRKVTFSPDTYNPKQTETCKLCDHRNISPDLKLMSKCYNCKKTFCMDCVSDYHNEFCQWCY